MAENEFKLTIDLNALNHLGIGLYSNIPAVLSEVVANSWDADAEKVEINIGDDVITLADDGYGMSFNDINNKYLKVGYSKRNKDAITTPKGRHVMGRKGIGKLSLFSIADTIEVHSVKCDDAGKIIEKNGFIMKTAAIKEQIKGDSGDYKPEAVKDESITITKGTKIFLSDLRKGTSTTAGYLRTRLARRFSIIGGEYGFTVDIDGKPISVEDRDYFDKIEYLWHCGEDSEKFATSCKNLKKHEKVSDVVDAAKGYKISGWVGTFDEQKSIEEGNNSIVILAWGKLIHEDVLKDLKEGGVFTKYLIGEIRADFLDLDNKDDIATSDRQSLKENDPRFIALKKFIQNEILKTIQSRWREWRTSDGEEKALKNPKIEEWFRGLSTENKKFARKLFSKIESIPVPNADFKKELYKQSILGFETLALKENLQVLENIDINEDFDTVKATFASMDELEAIHYWQITKNRIAVLKTFQDIAPKGKERLIQEHIFEHLWLLDPSWERASTDARMEESVTTEFDKIDAKLTPEEKAGRLDIRYRTAAGKHIIIELKKYDRDVGATELVDQVRKYRSALRKCLRETYNIKDPNIEAICILGSAPTPRDDDEENTRILAAAGARYMTYEELIQKTRDSYRDYLNKEKEVTRIQALIDSL